MEFRHESKRKHKPLAQVVGFVAPDNLQDAETQIATLRGEITIINNDVETRGKDFFVLESDYTTWKYAAKRSVSQKKAKITLLVNWTVQERKRLAELPKPPKPPSLTEQKTFRRRLIDMALASAKGEGDAEPVILPFEIPVSIEAAEIRVVELNTQILSLQAEITNLSSTRLSRLEWKVRRKEILKRLNPKQIERTFVGQWLKQTRRKAQDEIDARRAEMAQKVDPKDSTSLVFHLQIVLSRVLRETKHPLSSEEQDILIVTKKYLANHGLSD